MAVVSHLSQDIWIDMRLISVDFIWKGVLWRHHTHLHLREVHFISLGPLKRPASKLSTKIICLLRKVWLVLDSAMIQAAVRRRSSFLVSLRVSLFDHFKIKNNNNRDGRRQRVLRIWRWRQTLCGVRAKDDRWTGLGDYLELAIRWGGISIRLRWRGSCTEEGVLKNRDWQCDHNSSSDRSRYKGA